MANDILKQLWPEWEIEGKALGRGSFGVVYKGIRRDHNVESYAAIKVISIPADPSEVVSLRSEGLDADSARTYFQGIVNDFVSEIQLMESLKGLQNIVSIEDYRVVEKSGEIGWNICIRMELLTPFNTYICDKKLTEQEVIKLGCDICTALEICNSCNIIHRDIKPENIFVNKFGSYKLGDFGIARKLENMTGGLSHKGAFNYMAPEVIYSTKYDARVDIYSLGIVLYRLLNGNRLPLLDSDQQLMNPSERRNAVERRIRGEKLPPPCDASPAMADVILRACAFEPDARFATATEMKHALQRVANGINKKVDDKPDSTVPVYESPTEGDRSMYMPKTPPASRTPAEEIHTETLPTLEGNEKVEDKPDSTVPVYESPTAGDRSMYAPKTPPASGAPAEEIDVETQPPLEENKSKRAIITAIAAAVMGILAISILGTQVLPMTRYNNAVALMEKGNYQEAVEAFQAMGDYRDSVARATECTNFLRVKETAYQSAISLMEKENYQEAIVAFQAMGNYKDSATKASECVTLLNKETAYQNAIALMNKEDYQEANKAFKVLGDYKDSATKANECTTLHSKETSYQNAIAQMNKGNYQEASKAFKALGTYKDSATKASECTTLQSKETAYQSADALQKKGELAKAAIAFGKLGDYKDAKARSFALWDKVAQRDTISAGVYHTVGLKSDGTVVAAGYNGSGQCNVSGWKDIVAISAGIYHTVGLKSDGTVVAVGSNGSGQCNVSGWKDIVAISAGIYHTVGLKSDGTVVAVGSNSVGQCNVSSWKDIVAISAGNNYTVGLKSDGTVVAVGYNGSGRCNVSGWKDIVAISAGDYHTVGLKSDGTVVAVGSNGSGQCNVSGWKDIVAISAGDYHTVGLKSDGTVVAVGSNGSGQCNVSGWKDIKLPQ